MEEANKIQDARARRKNE
jgi:hypothetical protein